MTLGKNLLAAAVLAVSAWACHQAILTAPAGSAMSLFANPTFICSNGCTSTISAIVIEANTNTPVADGTVVQFFTTLGRIDEQGKTNDGVARVNLTSDGRSGTAGITAFSGSATANLGGGGNVPNPDPSASPGTGGSSGGNGVLIGNTSATRVSVSVDPLRIRPTDARVSTITATVTDAAGNFLAGVPVTFSAEGSGTEEIPGGFIFTDSNGQASVTLRTRYAREEPQKTVIIHATTANGVTGTTDLFIN